MSRALMWKIAFFSCFGFALGLVGTALYFSEKSGTDNGSRRIASLNKPPLHLMGKTLSLVNVSVRALEGIPEQEVQEVTLIGLLRLNQSVNQDLHYKWELPSGVHVVQGALQDSWAGVQGGQTAETRLTVTGFSKETLKLIVLHGFVRANDGEVGNSAVLTSRPDDSYEMLQNANNFATGVGAPEEGAKARPALKGRILR